MREAQEKFSALTINGQCRILRQLLNPFANNAASADLKLLSGKAGVGILLMSKNLESFKGNSIKLIYQSFTGFYEHEIDLMAEKI